MYTFAIMTNLSKDPTLAVTKRVMSGLDEKNSDYSFDGEVARALASRKTCEGVDIDVMLVLGGDGTMLTAARRYAPKNVMLLGINLGRVGFLMNCPLEELEKAIDNIIAGNFRAENRMLLYVQVFSQDGKRKFDSYALNEATLTAQSSMRMVDIAIAVDKNKVNRIACSAVLVSSPTGSTGYSLSAGGPVVAPELDVMLITPVCSHSMISCSYVISGDSEVRLTPARSAPMLILDGLPGIDLEIGDQVIIKKADCGAKFVHFKDKNFYSLLGEKLTEWTVDKGEK